MNSDNKIDIAEENYRNHDEECSTCGASYDEESPQRHRWKIAVIAVSTISLVLGLVCEFVLGNRLLGEALFLITAVVSGYSIAKNALRAAVRLSLDMNFLRIIAAIGAFVIGHGEEGAAVLFLFYIAEYLEGYSVERARKSVEALVKLAPETAKVKRNGVEVEVHVHEVEIGERMLIRPGDKIPLDGIVVDGTSSVNQATITGESVPITKEKGDQVFAGTINEEGFLEVEVTKKSTETILYKIVQLVEQAQRKKSKTEKFVDKFARYYTPAVVILAVLVAAVPSLLLGMNFSDWFYKALVLLVVACPCALAISTPVSIVSAITSAARNGVLIKGGEYAEEISKIKVFAFDKTGTLTEGKLQVSDLIGLNGYQPKVFLKVAASLESASEHPIAKAIVKRAKEEKLNTQEIEDFKSITGKGIRGRVANGVYYVGSRKLFQESGITIPEEKLNVLEEEGKTVILVGTEKELIGIISLRDKIRDVALSSLAELKKRGIKSVLITGDNERTARAIAREVGIDEYYAGLLPEEKVKIVNELRRKYRSVAMVGDGVNDAPALAEATVGITMGAIGSDVSLETADVALMKDDLSRLPYLVDLSKRTLEVIKENIIASITIKGGFGILAFPGIVTLWLAVAIGDMGLSLAVILNALRLSLIKPDRK